MMGGWLKEAPTSPEGDALLTTLLWSLVFSFEREALFMYSSFQKKHTTQIVEKVSDSEVTRLLITH